MKNILLIIALAIGTFSFSQVETAKQLDNAAVSADSSEIATANRIDEEVEMISRRVLLSKGQKEKIRRILVKHDTKISKNRGKLEDRNDKLEKKIRDVLTMKQQEKFDDVLRRHEEDGLKRNNGDTELEKEKADSENDAIELENVEE